MTTAGTTSRRMTCRKNDGPPGSVCRDRKSGRSPAFGNRLGQVPLTEHSIRSHTAPAVSPLWRTAGAVLFCGGSAGVCRRGPMPGGPCRILKDISSSSRQCTPQAASPPAPLTGEPSQTAAAKSLPCKGRWMRRQAQTEGCGAPPCKYPFGPPHSLGRRGPAQGRVLLYLEGYPCGKAAMHPSVGFARHYRFAVPASCGAR